MTAPLATGEKWCTYGPTITLSGRAADYCAPFSDAGLADGATVAVVVIRDAGNLAVFESAVYHTAGTLTLGAVSKSIGTLTAGDSVRVMACSTDATAAPWVGPLPPTDTERYQSWYNTDLASEGFLQLFVLTDGQWVSSNLPTQYAGLQAQLTAILIAGVAVHLTSYSQAASADLSAHYSDGTLTVPWGVCGIYVLTANTTIAFSDPPAAPTMKACELIIKQPADGGTYNYTLAYPAGADWQNELIVPMPSGASRKLRIYAVCDPDGTVSMSAAGYGPGV